MDDRKLQKRNNTVVSRNEINENVNSGLNHWYNISIDAFFLGGMNPTCTPGILSYCYLFWLCLNVKHWRENENNVHVSDPQRSLKREKKKENVPYSEQLLMT